MLPYFAMHRTSEIGLENFNSDDGPAPVGSVFNFETTQSPIMDTAWISVQVRAMEIWKQCSLMV